MVRRIFLAALIALSASAAEHTHTLVSPHQQGETLLRVVTPAALVQGRRYPVLYLLPVEPGLQARWGDPLAEALRIDLAGKYGVIVVLPTFSALPWFADHPSDPRLRQESYFLTDVVPVIDREYPTIASAEGRYLAGFSKSGWGAWSLLLRHPDLFARAAAWDAPLMESTPEKYGMAPIFGTQANFERYQITRLARRNADWLRGSSRLVLTGYFEGFRRQHIAMHELLEELAIPHVYRDGPKRAHHWQSGWLDETVELLLRVR